MILRRLWVCVIFAFVAGNAYAAEPQTGPVIKNFGPVFEVPDGSWNLQKDVHYKVSIQSAHHECFEEQRTLGLASFAERFSKALAG